MTGSEGPESGSGPGSGSEPGSGPGETGQGWQFWIDRGGTFTDVVARRPDGALLTAKVLSHNPEHYTDAALHGIRQCLGLAAGAAIAPETVAMVRMGTTVATNALLERTGAPTLLLITAGFADQLIIGDQSRPDIFALRIQRPEPLFAQVAEVEERVGADGVCVRPLSVAAARRALEAAYAAGLRACAVVLLHGCRYPAHEILVGCLARAVGFTQVSLSHRTSPVMRLVPRGETTVADAYLSPVLGRHVARVSQALAGIPLYFMQSGGGLVRAAHFRGRDAVLSGPAGGVVGVAAVAALAGAGRVAAGVIGFDMGGTSTDVCHYAGALERDWKATVAGVRLAAPMLRIATVAAGGGSVCRFDGLRYRVGPESAGAVPGPACYRRGGPLTLTDANVQLGILRPEFFPSVFGLQADQPLDPGAVAAAFATLADTVAVQTGRRPTAEAMADGFIEIAVASMANAIKTISLQRGHDVSRCALVSFGGAGGQHACRVAAALGMREVLLHPLAGVLSAWGIGQAAVTVLESVAVEAPLSAALPTLAGRLAQAQAAARQGLAAQGADAGAAVFQATVFLKVAGSDTPLAVVDDGSPAFFATEAGLRAAFAIAHRRLYGFAPAAEQPLVVESLVVEGRVGGVTLPALPALPPRASPLSPQTTAPVWLEGRWCTVPVYARAMLRPGDSLSGPALVVAETDATLIAAGWDGEMTADGLLRLRWRTAAENRPPASGESAPAPADPVRLEIFNQLFMAVAEQMGATLERTAHSVNIKERLDFSCAVFDAAGNLVANAPHMPVHLGSMGESVRTVLASAAGAELGPGDAVMLNDPYHGGTHLPDITVVSPVYDPAGRERLFWVASRGHHADIGGTTPGSMPPDSRTLAEEGIRITGFPLVKGGRFQAQAVRELLAAGPWPARNPERNLADLTAQLAANVTGSQALQRLVVAYGAPTVRAYMGHVQDNAEKLVRRALAGLSGGGFRLTLDNGAEIVLAIRIDPANGSAVVDFTGTSRQQADNFNAPAAVCRAAVLYGVRALLTEAIPLNEGCLRPLTLIIPPGSLLAPEPPAAVVAGNVETSQVVVDAFFGALGVLAASQGTMNNLTFGDARHQYYETVCGGSGAGNGFAGTAAIQTHMTNSRLTDPEVLESRFPVRVEAFRIRRGSGGAGRWPGGDGVERILTFTAPLTVALLAQRRTTAPFGLAGGAAGAAGEAWIRHPDGQITPLGGTARVAVEAGATLTLRTPGGGGFGGG